MKPVDRRDLIWNTKLAIVVPTSGNGRAYVQRSNTARLEKWTSHSQLGIRPQAIIQLGSLNHGERSGVGRNIRDGLKGA